ncbi:MAG: hypothetical protein AVO38_03860 [delta proteobacterium ML8_D]|jgi:hypothetical protein|nr:MAG: hypothetical protein AVO38_03860 [delta proteobacterium ML8_D]
MQQILKTKLLFLVLAVHKLKLIYPIIDHYVKLKAYSLKEIQGPGPYYRCLLLVFFEETAPLFPINLSWRASAVKGLRKGMEGSMLTAV